MLHRFSSQHIAIEGSLSTFDSGHFDQCSSIFACKNKLITYFAPKFKLSNSSVLFPQIAAGYKGSNFSMVWIWIGVLVLPALLPCRCWCRCWPWLWIGVSFCGCACHAGAGAGAGAGSAFCLALVPCWCWCRRCLWISASFCVMPEMTSGHARVMPRMTS